MRTFMCTIKPEWCDGYEFNVMYMMGGGISRLVVRNPRTEEYDWAQSPAIETTFDLQVGKYPFKFKFTKHTISVNEQNILYSPKTPWWKLGVSAQEGEDNKK